jgi:hypothetical protein
MTPADRLEAMRRRHDQTSRPGTRSTIRARARELAAATGLPCPDWAAPIRRERKPPPPKPVKPAPPPKPAPMPRENHYEPFDVKEARELAELRARIAAESDARWRAAAARMAARRPQFTGLARAP